MVKIKQLSESEKLAIFEQKKQEYLGSIHKELLELIAKAQKESVETNVSYDEEENIIVKFTFQKEYECATTRVPNSEEDLNNLQWALDSILIGIEDTKRKRIEREQMQEKKSRALNKLTAEERKLLGLA